MQVFCFFIAFFIAREKGLFGASAPMPIAVPSITMTPFAGAGDRVGYKIKHTRKIFSNIRG